MEKDEARTAPAGDAAVDRTETHPSGRTEPSLADHVHLPRGSTVDRYVVLDRIGAGGVGLVLEAYDPDLDRRIAIKLLRLRRSGDADALLREGRAVAQLNHPNVVTVHDVGEIGGQVFIAMERVTGGSLRDWLDAGPRDLDAILDVFAQAGSGLAAAHRAGIVHRDVKPSNILVDDDGRVRVVDFGLALGSQDLDEDGAPQTISQTSIAGTPAYMSPEQHRGEPLDARSDIFSFCVALWQAVHGERPYAGDTVAALRASVTAGERRPPPKNAKVPARLVALLDRGLATDPADRPASMDEVVTALTRRRRRLPIAAVVGGATAIALAAAGLTWGLTRATDSACSAAPDRVAEVWNDDARARIERAFAATDNPAAAAIAGRVNAALDEYTAGWATMHTESCRATRVTGEQSDALLDRRSRCLDLRLSVAGELITLLGEADAKLVTGAMDAINRLPPVAECAGDELLASTVAPPPPAIADRVAELEQALARAEALGIAGLSPEKLAVLEPVAAELEELDYPPLAARVNYHLALAYTRTDRPADAGPTFQRAARLAGRAGIPRLIAESWIALVMHRLRVDRDVDAAAELLPVAESSVELAGNRADLRAGLLLARAGLAFARSDHPEAIRLNEEAAALYAQIDDQRRLADTARNLGAMLLQSGDTKGAIDQLTRALAAAEQAFGPEHGAVVEALRYLSIARRRSGDLDGAEAALTRALALVPATNGERSEPAATLQESMALVAMQRGDFDAALEHFRSALAIYEALHGPDHPRVGNVHSGIGSVLKRKRDLDGAREHYQRSAEILEATVGVADLSYGAARYNQGELEEIAGNCSAALGHYTAALANFESKLGPEHPQLARPLLGLGTCALEAREWRAAIRHLERALPLADRSPPPVQQAVRFTLGRALYDSGRDRERGAELARAAAAALADLGGGSASAADEARDWLAARDLD